MLTGLNFHDEMVSMMSNVGDLGKTYTQSYNDWLDKHDKEIRADERAKTLDDLIRLVCEYYTMQERAGYCADTNNMIKQRISDFAEQLKEQNNE